MTILDQPEQTFQPPASEEKTMAILAHILTIVAGFLPPLIIYLIKKDESDYVRRHAAESLNFQLSLIIYVIVGIVLCLIIIGVFVLIALGIMALVFAILATVKASEGGFYKYPLTIRFVS